MPWTSGRRNLLMSAAALGAVMTARPSRGADTTTDVRAGRSAGLVGETLAHQPGATVSGLRSRAGLDHRILVAEPPGPIRK